MVATMKMIIFLIEDVNGEQYVNFRKYIFDEKGPLNRKIAV